VAGPGRAVGQTIDDLTDGRTGSRWFVGLLAAWLGWSGLDWTGLMMMPVVVMVVMVVVVVVVEEEEEEEEEEGQQRKQLMKLAAARLGAFFGEPRATKRLRAWRPGRRGWTTCNNPRIARRQCHAFLSSMYEAQGFGREKGGE